MAPSSSSRVGQLAKDGIKFLVTQLHFTNGSVSQCLDKAMDLYNVVLDRVDWLWAYARHSSVAHYILWEGIDLSRFGIQTCRFDLLTL